MDSKEWLERLARNRVNEKKKLRLQACASEIGDLRNRIEELERYAADVNEWLGSEFLLGGRGYFLDKTKDVLK